MLYICISYKLATFVLYTTCYIFQIVVTEVESGNHFYSQFVDQGMYVATLLIHREPEGMDM